MGQLNSRTGFLRTAWIDDERLDSLGKWHETENIDGKVGLSFG
jgi:hypothetical protein